MQASQRAQFNHALEYAIEQANELKLPVVVCFGLMDGYPEANARHYTFMLQGLRNVFDDLRERGIRFVVKHGASARVALHYAKDAAMVVCDRGYTRHQKAWREEVARAARCWVVQVESDVVVPVEVASDKFEFAARTIRSKIQKKLAECLKSVKAAEVKRPSLTMRIHGDV
jgi:deoxyribodipyrimidine photo-lyase